MRKKKKRSQQRLTPEIESDKILTVKLRCLVCGEKTGVTMDVRESMHPAGIEDVRDGLCPKCEEARQQGCCLVFTSDTGVILEKSWADKFLKPELRDKFIGAVNRISKKDMNMIKRAWKNGLQRN